MSTVTEVMSGNQAAPVRSAETTDTSRTSRTSKVSGRTVGNPQLTEKAADYYDELRRKNPDMEFILVSKDQKNMAQAQAASYSNPNRMVVLIDEEKIERMAEDESYRKKYEGIIANGASQLKQMAQKLTASGANVKGFGMQVKDNRASFFAAVDKSFADQRTRVQEKRAEKKAAQKAEAKKEAKREAQEKLRERIEERRGDADSEDWSSRPAQSEDVVVFSADSMEELLQKVDDYVLAERSNQVMTDNERKVGGNFDFAV